MSIFGYGGEIKDVGLDYLVRDYLVLKAKLNKNMLQAQPGTKVEVEGGFGFLLVFNGKTIHLKEREAEAHQHVADNELPYLWRRLNAIRDFAKDPFNLAVVEHSLRVILRSGNKFDLFLEVSLWVETPERK
mgnify:CR=1 FL=1